MFPKLRSITHGADNDNFPQKPPTLAETITDAFGRTGIVVECPICDGVGHMYYETKQRKCSACWGHGWYCEAEELH